MNAARGDQASHHADREAADDVDQKDAERKRCPEPRMDDVVGKVAEEGAHAAADGNRQ